MINVVAWRWPLAIERSSFKLSHFLEWLIVGSDSFRHCLICDWCSRELTYLTVWRDPRAPGLKPKIFYSPLHLHSLVNISGEIVQHNFSFVDLRGGNGCLKLLCAVSAQIVILDVIGFNLGKKLISANENPPRNVLKFVYLASAVEVGDRKTENNSFIKLFINVESRLWSVSVPRRDSRCQSLSPGPLLASHHSGHSQAKQGSW